MAATPSTCALELQSIAQRLGGEKILHDVSLHARRGEIYGLLGPNGAGKTTTIRTLLGVLTPTAGRVQVRGSDPVENPSVREDMGVVYDYETLNPKWTVRDNLAHTAAVYGVEGADAAGLLDRVDLDCDELGNRFGELSKGMKRKAAIANALVPDPDLLVLDEPASGLDPSAQRTVEALLTDLSSADKTILLSSHQLPRVHRLCDRIGIIRDGRMARELDVEGRDVALDELYFSILEEKS